MAATAATLAAAFVLPRFVHAPDLDENRVLAPALHRPHDLAALAAWPKAADAYVADHFPARAQLIAGLNYLRLRLGVSGSSRVVVGRDGWLFYDDGTHLGKARDAVPYSDSEARDWLMGLAGRTEYLRQRGAAYLVMAAPDKETVYPQMGPPWFTLSPERASVRLLRLARESQAGDAVYPRDDLVRHARWGLTAYSADDTHWTGAGAYLGYVALMRRLQALGITDGPRPLESFREANVGGVKPRNLALMLGVASFVPIDYPEFDDATMDGRLKTTWLGAGRDWTKPRVVDTGQTGKPVLLMTMDSFSNALLPFLYSHFSRIVLAHNQDGTWRPDLIERFKPNVVVLEVVESGFTAVMSPAPPPSAAARARIAAAFALERATRAQRIAQEARLATATPGGGYRVLEGGAGPDRLEGGPAADIISGRQGDDTIAGGGGDDTLRGGQGDDVIAGGPGDDYISGDRGDDTLSGGPGADTFHIFPGAGSDLVTDFNAAEGDRVTVEGGGPYSVRQIGPDTVIELRGARLTLRGVKAASLPSGAIGAE